MPPKISDVFFDLDHTLWDFDKNSALAFRSIFPKLNIQVDIDLFIEFYIPINYEYWEMYRKDEITHQELRYGRFKKTFDLLAFDIDEETIMAISAEYVRCLPDNNHLFDGTLDILEYLGSRYRLHIITNGFAEVQKRKLDNSGIRHYFTTITNSEMAGCKKPDPVIFEYALKSAGTTSQNSIMIGDCIEADVRGALNSGFDAIYFSIDSEVSYDGIKQIKHLSDLKKYL